VQQARSKQQASLISRLPLDPLLLLLLLLSSFLSLLALNKTLLLPRIEIRCNLSIMKLLLQSFAQPALFGRRLPAAKNHNFRPHARGSTSSSKNKPPTTTPPEASQLAPHVIPKAFAVGSLAGMCGSLAGMGGGFIMIPLMTSSLLRLSQHQAHGTSLFAVTTTGIAGALGYSGQVDYEAAAAIACCGMVTARFGAQATTRLSGPALKKALGVFMLCVAPLVPAKTYLVSEEDEDSTEEENQKRPLPQRILVPAAIGCCSGFLAGLFGVGGGAIVVPALTLGTDMNHYQALGTSLCAMSLPAMVGTATHYGKGNVAMRVAPALAVGAFLGGYFGGRLGLTIDESKLKWGFSILMLTLGGRTLLT
jgi:uncharacterized membrane protein YfcA